MVEFGWGKAEKFGTFIIYLSNTPLLNKNSQKELYI